MFLFICWKGDEEIGIEVSNARSLLLLQSNHTSIFLEIRKMMDIIVMDVSVLLFREYNKVK
jgi:hypothetical protein